VAVKLLVGVLVEVLVNTGV
jgi:hypothetical protein